MLEQGKFYGERCCIKHKTGKKAIIMVYNFHVLGVATGHYCNYIKRGRIKSGGFVLKYDELKNWKLDEKAKS